MKKTKPCPCNPSNSYALCCGRYHKGKIHAPTAEALMRSRFSAYVSNNTQYIYRTWDEHTRPPLKVLRTANAQVFTTLEIINTTKGNTDDETGTVEFKANYTLESNAEVFTHHENSTFIKRKNHWYYVKDIR